MAGGKGATNMIRDYDIFNVLQQHFPLLLCLYISGFNTFYSSRTFGRRYPDETATAATGMFYFYNSI